MEKSQTDELITLIDDCRPTELPVITSLLKAAGIDFDVKGAGVQDLIGAGAIGTGFNVATGPVSVRVRAGDAERAREVLEPGRRDDGDG